MYCIILTSSMRPNRRHVFFLTSLTPVRVWFQIHIFLQKFHVRSIVHVSGLTLLKILNTVRTGDSGEYFIIGCDSFCNNKSTVNDPRGHRLDGDYTCLRNGCVHRRSPVPNHPVLIYSSKSICSNI